MFLFFRIVANLQDERLAECPGKFQRFVIALPRKRDECYEDDSAKVLQFTKPRKVSLMQMVSPSP